MRETQPDVHDLHVADTRPPPSPSVLVATAFDAASEVALRRGQALARILQARLVVLHVIPSPSFINMLFPQKHALDALAMEAMASTATEAARAWCEEVLGADAEAPTIVFERGRVAGSILKAARDAQASMIVLGDSPGVGSALFGGGGIAAAVIHRAPIPVLVARPERPGNEIVAATNFADGKYPALNQAVRLGVRLGAHVTFVHNVDAGDHVAAASFFGFPFPTTVLPREPDLGRRAQELAEVARFIGTDIETVVVTKARTADAILEVARGRDADLVVVGTRRRHGVVDMGSLGTAATVAQEARRSVLTVPLRAREPSGWAA